MKKIIIFIVVSLTLLVATFLFVQFNNNDPVIEPTPIYVPDFSDEANQNFISTIAKNVNLNSGITVERIAPLLPEQSNNIAFAVFNHTDEPIIFTDQVFGLSVFSYNTDNFTWEILQLPHEPYKESRILPPKVEAWDPEINNSWDILENDSLALGQKQIRLYISGTGKTTNKIYGAYLDVAISLSP